MIPDQTRQSEAVSPTSSRTHRARIFVWIWGGIQIIGGIALSYFTDRLVSDPAAIATLKPLLIFFGVSLGVTYIALEVQLDGVLSREIGVMKEDLLNQKRELSDAIADVVGRTVARELGDIKALLPVFDAYIRGGASDDYGAREKILSVAQERLRELAGGRYELEGDEYYDWLRDRLIERRPQIVRAISFRPLSVYSNDTREKNFVRHNSDAIAAGTTIQRIFIIEHSELLDSSCRAVLRSHFIESGASCYVAWKDQLSSELAAKMAGGGLSIYDSDYVFFDRSYFAVNVAEKAGRAEGQVIIPRAVVYSKNDPDFKSLVRMYENLLANFVDPNLKRVSGAAAYKWCCETLLTWASSTSQPDNKIEELRLEIETLSKT